MFGIEVRDADKIVRGMIISANTKANFRYNALRLARCRQGVVAGFANFPATGGAHLYSEE